MADKAVTIKEYLAAPAVMRRVEEMLDRRASQFTTSVLALAGSDPKIMECEPRSLFNACLTAAALDLPINKNLGFAHIIPYKNNKTGIIEAQFQMGWKGFVQLAQRSGQYKTISSTEVYEGQLLHSDALRGNQYDWTAKSSDKIVGYVSIIVLNNGFEHELYMSAEDMEKHAKRYSQAYSKGYQTPWKDNFPAMAAKTVIKLNISKFGPMSVELERALVNDQAIIRDEGNEYIDGTDLLDGEKATDEAKAAILAFNGKAVEDGIDRLDAKAVEGEITEDGKLEVQTSLTDAEKAEIEADEKKAAAKK